MTGTTKSTAFLKQCSPLWSGPAALITALAAFGSCEASDGGGPSGMTLRGSLVEEITPNVSASADRRTIQVRPPVDVLDGRSFRWHGATLTLEGVAAPDTTTLCFAKDDTAWSCAELAKRSFRSLVQRELECVAVGRPPNLMARCMSGGEDIARLHVASGWVQPAAGAPPELAAESTRAREAGRGLWAWRTGDGTAFR
jgi:endonuclease YncB( thermonuclease family)